MDLLDLARHVRTEAGVRRYHKPIGALISGRDTARAIVKGARIATAFANAHNKGTGVSKGTLNDPINCAGNVVLAAKLLSEGKHIRLNKEAEVGTLLDRLAYLTAEAAKQGKDAPNIDLCKVSVPKTNLFCAQTKNIPRAKMPQLSGVAVKGSKADALPKVRGNEVDIIPEFRKELARRGIKVTDTSMPADHLKATQDQLIGPKVAGIYEAMKAAPSNSGLFERIMVTKDGYVIDGHHRWAAQVALETTKGTPASKMKMKVTVLDIEIGAALDLSLAFAADWGIPQQGFVLNQPAVPKELSRPPEDLVDLARHVRTEAGVRKYHLPKGSLIVAHPDAPSIPNPVKTEVPKAPKAKGRPNPAYVTLNDEDYTLDDAVAVVGDAYDWPFRDKRGGKGSDPASILMQDKAQIIAKSWASEDTVGVDDEMAKYVWQEYQNPRVYGDINRSLRKGEPVGGQDEVLYGTPAEKVASTVDKMFEEGGYTTEKPMTVYRALRSTLVPTYEGKPMPAVGIVYRNWAEQLKPGTVFTDKGIISTTAHKRLSQGWLLNDDVGSPTRMNRVNKDDVVVEIRVPTGTRVVGGDPQFIETMLHPGSRFRVISSTVEKANGIDPITADKKTFDHTHVVAELVPDGG